MLSDLSTLLNRSLGKTSLGDILAAVITLLLCLVVVRLVLKVVRRLLGRSKLDQRVQRYVLAAVRLLLYLLTGLIVAESLNIDMTSLVAMLSVGSLGVTLAAEDILGNVAGGLVILSSHPFSLGDFVEVSGTSGTVVITTNDAFSAGKWIVGAGTIEVDIDLSTGTGSKVQGFAPEVFPINVGKYLFAPGVYMVRVTTGTGEVLVGRIIAR